MKYHYLVSEKDHVNGGLPVNDSAMSLGFLLVSFLDVTEIYYFGTL